MCDIFLINQTNHLKLDNKLFTYQKNEFYFTWFCLSWANVFTHLNSWCAIEKLKAKWFRNAENMNCFRFNTAAAAEDFHARITTT